MMFEHDLQQALEVGQLQLAGFYDCGPVEFLYRTSQMMIARLTAQAHARFLADFPDHMLRLAPLPAAALAEFGARAGWC
jgi:hypothetical protein